MSLKSIKHFTAAGLRAAMLYALGNLGGMWYSGILFKLDSDQIDGEDLGWLGGLPGMAERVGDPSFNKIAENELYIAHKTYESNITIPKDIWTKAKNASQVRMRVSQLMSVVKNHPSELLQTLISVGSSSACYDGEYFFDTDHAEGDSGTQSNDLTVAIVDKDDPTVAELSDAILDCIEAIIGFKDDKGNEMSLDATSFRVTVPKALWKNAKKAVAQFRLASGESNALIDIKDIQIDVTMLPRWTATDAFCVFRDDEAAAPFVMSTFRDPYVKVLDENSEYCELHDQIAVMCNGKYGITYGLWQHACLMTFTTA